MKRTPCPEFEELSVKYKQADDERKLLRSRMVELEPVAAAAVDLSNEVADLRARIAMMAVAK